MSHDPSPDPSSPPGSAPGAALSGLLDGPRTGLTDNDRSPVVTATISVEGFVDGWIHCQHIADYLARFAASDRFDPAQLTTRLSTYLNEVLELVFRSETAAATPAPGTIVVAIHRLPDRLQVELRCPPSERLRRSVRRATEPDAAATFRREFADLLRSQPDGADAADAGLLELVALHGIGLELHEAGDTVVLRMTVPHE
jgi:hypothetical protein